MRRRIKKSKTTTKKKINVFLDLDNTLIWSLDLEKISKDPPKWMKKFKYIDMPKEYRIFQRPGLQKFLNWLFKNFNVSIWSAASPAYVEFIAKNIVENDNRQLEHVLNSENCALYSAFRRHLRFRFMCISIEQVSVIPKH
jgi:TFIIF-interacting CTD phosphatase-like protein